MNVRTYIIFLSLITIISLTPFAFAQLLEISLSKEVYFEGDVIVVSGSVSSVEYARLTLQIIHLGQNEESIVQIAQVDVAQDGSFSYTVKADGPQWRMDGEYVVRAFYGVDSVADAYFDFFVKEETQSLIFEVDKPDQTGTFDVEYLINGGSIKDIIVDEEFFELIVLIDSKREGEVTLELPRDAIDAKKSDGTDDVFIVLIDGVEAPYTETQNDSNSRTITIEFEEYDSDIEIIGTNVLKPLPISSSSGLSSVGIFSDSKFRLIPEKPNVGSMIRVAGENFAENVKLELYLENSKLETFSTNKDGTFVITTQIPSSQQADRVDFFIRDTQGTEKTISVRLGGEEKRVVSDDVPFTVDPITTTNEKEPKPEYQESDFSDFVDPSEDPQYYVDRYNNEPEFKEWFDTYYPQYSSIYEAVGLPEPIEQKLPDWVRNIFIWYAEGQIGEGDLISALEFLINEGIIKVKT